MIQVAASTWISPRSGTWPLSGSCSTRKEFYLDKPWYCHKKGPLIRFWGKCARIPVNYARDEAPKWRLSNEGSSGAPSTWSKLRSRSVLDPEHRIYLDQSGKIGSRSCLCLEKGADLNQDPPLDDPGRSFDLDQSSTRNLGFIWINLGR